MRTSTKLQQVDLYNLRWPVGTNPVMREMEMLFRGGRWRKKDETLAGEGMEFHFKALMKLLWRLAKSSALNAGFRLPAHA